jgi:serine/threonine protein kinase
MTSSAAPHLPHGQATVPFSPMAALKELVKNWLLPKNDLVSLATAVRKDLLSCRTQEELFSNLVDWRLLTPFQAQRILKGATFGLVLGDYRVLDRLGSGSMGVVYLGEHRTYRQPVAIKVLPFRDDQDPRVLRRFRNEIDTVARLSHPHIVAAIDIGGASRPDDGGTVLHYFVMEYLRGLDLQRLVRDDGPLSLVQACLWCGQIASALAEAQRHGLVHRDIKPSNIIIKDDGRAKLLDFGLAFFDSQNTDASGSIVGTIDYMAPEQFENPYGVDHRADLYSLGAVLYWCLTGQPPFPTDGSRIVDFSTRLTAVPPSVRKHRPELPRSIDLLIRRLLMLHPDDRIDSARDVVHVLRKFAE